MNRCNRVLRKIVVAEVLLFRRSASPASSPRHSAAKVWVTSIRLPAICLLVEPGPLFAAVMFC
jgi:hypothetical protein